jgi:hypothetical protein
MVFTGCASGRSAGGASPGGPSGAIQELSLFSAPVAVNFDGLPGPDGLSLRVYAGNAQLPKSLPIKTGTLEVLMFDGLIKAEEAATAKPLHVWSYPATDLIGYGQKTSIGMSYVLTPLWGKDKPTKNRVTVLVRYLPPQGITLYSAPTVIFSNAN